MADISRGAIRKRVWRYEGKKRVAYAFSVVVNGKRIRKQFEDKATAEAELDALKESARAPRPEVQALTLKEATDRYLDLKARKKSLAGDKKIIRHLLSAFGEDIQLQDLTNDRIASYRAARLKSTRTIGEGENAVTRPLTSAAVNRPLALLRHLFKLAHEEWGALAEVPRIRLEKEPRGKLRFLSEPEAVKLLDACSKSKNKALADLVELVAFTGLRQGEALGLTWSRVDRSRGVIRLEQTKADRPREVPLSARADAVLARRWTDSANGYVFGSRNWNSFRTSWEFALDRAGLDETVTFHTLRHTCASWLVQRGRSLLEVKDLLGHQTVAMSARYAHLAPEHLRAAVSVLDDVLPAASSARAQHGHQDRVL